MLRRLILFLFWPALVSTAGAQADSWLEVSTPHFRVISNASEKDARHTAIQFERMRSVFARVFPDANIDTATPMVVLALQDKRNFQALEPAVYLGAGQVNLLGL